jgi:hypothetical protein
MTAREIEAHFAKTLDDLATVDPDESTHDAWARGRARIVRAYVLDGRNALYRASEMYRDESERSAYVRDAEHCAQQARSNLADVIARELST